MEISGPCKVIVKDGLVFNKYLITQEIKNYALSGSSWTCYYFDTKEDAELYLLFLYQKEGVKFLEQQINSPKTYLYDKKEFMEFRDSIDFLALPAKISNINVVIEQKFTKWKKRLD